MRTLILFILICSNLMAYSQDCILSDEAKRHWVRAQTIIKNASSGNDYREAIKEYEKILGIESKITGEVKFETTLIDIPFEVFLRDSPDINSKETYPCPKNSAISVIDDTGLGYFFVIVDGHKGFISKKFLSDTIIPSSCPDVYYNIALCYEKLKTTSDYNNAIHYYKKYIDSKPHSSDITKVQNKIYEIEYLVEKQSEKEKYIGKWRCYQKTYSNYNKRIIDRDDENYDLEININKDGNLEAKVLLNVAYYIDNRDRLISKDVDCQVIPIKIEDGKISFTYSWSWENIGNNFYSSGGETNHFILQLRNNRLEGNWEHNPSKPYNPKDKFGFYITSFYFQKI